MCRYAYAARDIIPLEPESCKSGRKFYYHVVIQLLEIVSIVIQSHRTLVIILRSNVQSTRNDVLVTL